MYKYKREKYDFKINMESCRCIKSISRTPEQGLRQIVPHFEMSYEWFTKILQFKKIMKPRCVFPLLSNHSQKIGFSSINYLSTILTAKKYLKTCTAEIFIESDGISNHQYVKWTYIL